MDDVPLGNVADVTTNGVKVFVDTDVVDVYRAVRGRPVSGDGIDQGRFTTPTLANNNDKLPRLED